MQDTLESNPDDEIDVPDERRKTMRFIIPVTMFLVSGLFLCCPQTSNAAPAIKKQVGFATIIQASLDERRYDQIRHSRHDRYDNRRYDNRRHDHRSSYDRYDRHHRHDRFDRHDRKHHRVKHIDRHRHGRHDHRRNSIWLAWPGFFFGSYAHTNCR